jgi:transposase
MVENRWGSRHYSTEFKLSVIAEIEADKLTAWGAQRKYGIGGNTTVYRWLRDLGSSDLVGRDEKMEMSKKTDRLEEVKEKNRLLESALAEAQLKILALESLVEVANDHYGENLKKNFGSEALKRRKRKKRK